MAVLTFIFLAIAALSIVNSSKNLNTIHDEWTSLQQQQNPDNFLFRSTLKKLDSPPSAAVADDCFSDEKCFRESNEGDL